MPVKHQRFCLVCFFAFSVFFPALGNAQPAASHYSRVICLGPSVTESLFALGCGDVVVGVSDYCIYPPEAINKPKVGGLLNPNLERYAALQPDLVIFRGALDKVKDYCLSRNIAVMETEMDSIQSISDTITQLGSVFGKEERAQALIADIQKELNGIRKEVSGLPRPKVFLCVGRTPGGLSSIFTCSKTSFVSQVLDVAGGVNIFSDVPTAYPEISKESLMRQAPDIILEMRPSEEFSPAQIERLVDEWSIMRTLPAVRNKKVYVMTQDYLLVPGPRVGQAAKAIAKTIHSGSAAEK